MGISVALSRAGASSATSAVLLRRVGVATVREGGVGGRLEVHVRKGYMVALSNTLEL